MSQKKFYFVYGTLKRGFGNNVFMKDANFVDKATTVEHFTMTGFGFPYIYKGSDDRPVVGEVFIVNNSDTERDLDWLEGVESNHYEKILTPVALSNGEVVEAYAYQASNETVRGFHMPSTLGYEGDYWEWE